MITVNGVKRTLEQPLSVTEYLEKNQYVPVQVAIELNDQILARELYGSTILKEGDVMAIVSFMGGGSGKNEEMDRTLKKQEHRSLRLLFVVQIRGDLRIFWTTFQRTLRFFQIPPEREMQRRLCVLQDFPESLDVEILSRLK